MEPQVETSTGPVLGTAGDRVLAFLGIPYAAPPTGALRWQPPQPRDSWVKPRECRSCGPAAWQPLGGPLNGLVPGMGVTAMGSDCLTLNVWTPNLGGKAPVLVWIHGGGYQIGSSNLPVYDGARLARRTDAVVVSINYRLGAFGWMLIDHPDAAANCGLLDQIAALEWVRDNIAAFGGDPAQVTVFGESAGGGSVLSLLSSKQSAGLFANAIVQSGATDLTLTRDDALKVTATFADVVECRPSDLLALQALSSEQVLAAQQETANRLAASGGLMVFHPVVDGEVMSAGWLDARRQGLHAEVGLMIGTTHDELNLFVNFDPSWRTLDDAGLAARVAKLHRNPALLIDAYRDLHPEHTPGQIWNAINTDSAMWLPALRVAEAHAAHQPRTFMYRFDWPAADDELGAPHGIDIPFPFDTIDVDGWDSFVDGPERARLLAKAVQHAWAAFGRTGDPTSPNLPTWDAFSPAGRATMILGPSPQLVHDPRSTIRVAWSG